MGSGPQALSPSQVESGGGEAYLLDRRDTDPTEHVQFPIFTARC